MPKEKPVSEAEASVMLQLAQKKDSPIRDDFITRITREWFEVRRTLGIDVYGDDDVVEKLRERLGR